MRAEIVGRSCLTPGADSPDSLFRLLRDGQCAVTQVPRDRWDQSRYWHPEIGVAGKTYTFAAGVVDDIYAFDSAVFGMSGREAAFLDPQQRIILNLTWRALEDANIDPANLLGRNVGVYIGASGLDHANLIGEDPAAAGPYFMSGNTLSVVSNRISHIFGLSGPSMTIDTACSSSLVALEQAFNAIVSGAIDMAIVGGVNVLSHPLPFIGFAQARMLSPEGLCRAYDDAGAGYVRAEGGAVFILRRSDIAACEGDRSHATIAACASNSAGRTNGISLPSPDAQAALLSSIYHESGIDPSRLAFVEGHGTGTQAGDPAELWALGTAIGQKRQAPIPVGSIKTNIGHAEAASGALGLMKAMLALEHNFFPASLHFQTPNRNVDLDALNVHVTDKGLELLPDRRGRFAGVNSFGFGGTNAHAVICDPPQFAPLKTDSLANPVFLASAHSKSALENLLSEYRDRMTRSPDQADDLIRTAGANRTWLHHRFVVPDATAATLKHSISGFLQGEKPDGYRYGTATRADADVAFVFSGNGAQWAGMGIDAYREDARFKARFDEIAALFRLYFEEDFSALLRDEGLSGRLSDTTVAQPLLFALQAALADSLVQQGLKPAVVFGHSVGEVTAAYVAGALSLMDAVRVVATRSTHQQRTAGMGGMAAIGATAEVATELFYKNGFANLSIAAYNARASVTISGPNKEIQAFVAVARGAKIAATVLDIDYPFHHPMMDAGKDAFIADLSNLVPNESRLPFISSVTGQVLPGTALDAHYWWQNLREPVLFAKAAAAALESGAQLLLEIGPRPILKTYLQDAAEMAGRGLALTSLVKTPVGGAHENPVCSVFADALAHGAAIERKSVFGKRDSATQHPVLPFDQDAPTPAHTSDAVNLYGRQTTASRLAGWRVDPLGSTWKNHVDAYLLADLAEHVVDGKAILPATGFLEIAISATQEFLGAEQVEIHDFVLLHPLELKTDQITELSTVISPETNDIEIRSRPRLSEDDWTLHAKGRIRHCDTIDTIVTAKRSDASPARTRLSADAYAIAARLGLCYGPKFQLLESASTFDERTIHVALKAPQSPSNPYLEYAVNPISADAALHGLIAMLAAQGGHKSDAPYIPVRIGCASVLSHGATVAGATIEIRSAATETIRADLTLHDASGKSVMAIRELRLKRTHLRQRASLEARSFHYDSVPSLAVSRQGMRPIDDEALHGWIDALTPEQPDSSTLLLGATAYRVAFDTIEAVIDQQRLMPPSVLSDGGEQALFHSLCLQWLASAGLATMGETGWKLADKCEIPDIATLIRLIDREDGRRLVEALALANAGSGDALCRASPRNPTSEATFDHLLVHSLPAQARLGLLEEGVRTILAESNVLRPVVVELGSASASLSERMAELVRQKDGRTIIIEDREQVRDMLTLHFADQPHVDIVESGNFPKDIGAGLVFSAYHDLYSLIADSPRVSALVRRLTGAGSAVFAAAGAPGIVADMTYGQQPEWLSRAGERIAGRLATQADWKSLLDSLGVRHSTVRSLSLGSGEFIVLGGSGRTLNDDAGHEAKATLTAAPIWIGSRKPFESALERALSQATERGVALVYDHQNDAGIDGPTRLQKAMTELALAAERLNALATASSTVPPLLVLLDGGAPAGWDATSTMTSDPANAGLWMFLRTVRNEYPAISIRSIDCRGQPRDGQQFSELISQYDASGGGSFEWLLAEDGALREIRAVPGPAPTSSLMTHAFEAATVSQTAGSSIAGIGWTTCGRTQPSANQLLIEVAATGLNFRDVMWAMGMLPAEALEDGFAGMTLGMECAGTVVAVGDGVSRFSIGDRVMAFAPAAFSTHVTVDARAAMALPDNISEAAGATIPVAFLTAWYALVELGRLKAGETVLVHGGAGGVGLTALQIAKLRGARVIATAGSEEKRSLLHLLGADHVLDSRSLAFVAAVEKLTDGAGVDVILNSLSGDAMERSIGLLKPFGRFLELGKRDFYADRKIGLRPFRRNVSYFGIDADQLLLADPALTQSLFNTLAGLFADAKLHALPHRVFNHDEIRSAFRLMQGSGHIGKIVVKPPQAGRDAVRHRKGASLVMDTAGMHLVVGGIGGFGLAAADWLVEKGALKIALCSRRGIADDATLDHIRSWEATGVETTVLACDVTNRAQVETMLAGLRSKALLKSVIHAAMVLDDGLLPNLSPKRNKPVVETKALGSEYLDALTRADDLDHFILFSSLSTLIGNIGQANYVAANGYLEGIARRRRIGGLPALTVAFGPISDFGLLPARTALGDRLATRLGDTAMPAREALRHLESVIIGDRQATDGSCVVIANLDWPSVSRLAVAKSNLFLPVQRSRRSSQGASGADNRNLATLLADKPEAEAEAMVFAIVAEELAAALQIPLSGVSRALLLRDAGLDSLMAVELAIGIEKRTGFELSLNGLSETTTLGELTGKLLAKARKTEATEIAAAENTVRQLASKHSATG